MVIILHDPTDDTFYAIDQANKINSVDWVSTIEEASTMLDKDGLSDDYFTMTIEQFREKFSSYEIYYHDATPQPYEYW